MDGFAAVLHCKNFAPHRAAAATELRGRVKLGALSTTINTIIANRFQAFFPSASFTAVIFQILIIIIEVGITLSAVK